MTNAEDSKPPEKKQKSDPQFSEVHAEAYGRRGFRWPAPQKELKERLGDDLALMNQRPAECAMYYEKAFPFFLDPLPTQ